MIGTILHVIRRAGALLVAGIGINLVGIGSAHAQLAPLYNQLMNTVQQQVVKQVMTQMGLGVEAAVAQSGAATQAEILKGTMANRAVLEGLESYRQQEKLRQAAQDTADSLRQPATTCQTVAVQGGIGSATHTASAGVAGSQSRVMRKLGSNTNTVQALEASHQATNASLCKPEEERNGICRVNQNLSGLAGADQNAAFLFHSRDGSLTYEGPRNGPQAQAADGYIDRIAGVPPEQLSQSDYGKSVQGRAYIELMRRFKAMLSMSTYSLNQIKEARNPQTNLGNDTMMANAPGFTQGKSDMSMLEAVQRFVETKFSAESMRDAAKATNENLILRDMAQTNAFQLWIDHQTLLQDTRTEALMAHQLALLTEQTLRPTLDAQRVAAERASRVAK